MDSKTLHMVSFILVIAGALNWGLIGVANFDLVAWLFTDLMGLAIVTKLVYILVGIAALYEVVTHKSSCVHCGASASAGSGPASGQGMGAPGGM